MIRKHYKVRNNKTIPIVEITLLGLSGTIYSMPNFGVHKIKNPIKLPISPGIVTIIQ